MRKTHLPKPAETIPAKEEIKEEYDEHDIDEYADNLERAKIQLALFKGDLSIADVDTAFIDKTRKEIDALTEYINITQSTLEGQMVIRKNSRTAKRARQKRVP